MKKPLLLLFFAMNLFWVDAQDYGNLDQSTIDLINSYRHKVDSDFNKKNRISLRDEYKIDSMYLYESVIDNLVEKTIYTDHSSLNPLGTNSQTFTVNGASMSSESVTTRTFDADGNLLSATTELFQNGLLVPVEKLDYTYDANGNELSLTLSDWDLGTQAWAESLLNVSTWNSNNQLEAFSLNIWDSTNDDWLLFLTTELTYMNDLLVGADEVFAFSGQSPTNRVYFYNAENELDSNYLFNILPTGELDLSSRNIFTYPDELTVVRERSNFVAANTWDPTGRFIETQYADIPRLRYSDSYSSAPNSATFQFTDREEWFYSTNPLEVVQPTDKDISLNVANPFSRTDVVKIKGITTGTATTFSLIDMAGNVILQKQFSQDIQFAIDNALPSGIYIMSLSQNNRIVTNRKVVKQN